MEPLTEIYLTPEQAAQKLQVVTKTVYRWLRSGKLRGSLLSAKAWRISQRELDAFLRRQTISELLFEQYLEDNRLGPAEHEPAIAGRTSRLDYRVVYQGKPLWFEVKEFGEADVGYSGAFDPYISIRNRIGKAAKQFNDYKGETCSIVFYNDRLNLASIYSPEIVLGAMLGNVSVSVPVDLESGKEVGPARTSFSEGGKLIHPTLKVPQNTTISAIIALERFGVGSREFRVMVVRKEEAERRRLSWTEFFESLESDRQKHNRQVLRTLVYENPYAASPLPRDIFNGPYDERWGRIDGEPLIGRIFVGKELRKLEESERQFDLHLSPIAKYMKNGPRKKREL
ncbi:MAG: helix-turn-helix domain-containing protein [Bryobacteraceae bacterium]